MTGSGACAVDASGTLQCWGLSAVVRHAPQGSGFVAVSAYSTTLCALRSNGQAECWDRGDAWAVEPGPLASVTAGDGFACGLRPDSTIYCWGDGVPAGQPTGMFRQVDAGMETACAVGTDGSVSCWSSGTMVAPPAGNDFERVVAHVWRACALSPRGVECWGTSGTPTLEAQGTYLTLDVFDDRCAISSANEIVCWEGTVPVTGQFVDIALRDTQVGCAVAIDGSVQCWGSTVEQVPEGLRVF